MALLNSDKSNILFKHYLGTGSTRASREFFEEAIKSSFIVNPCQLWTYADQIPISGENPGIEKVQSLSNGQIYYWYKSEKEKEVPLIKKWENLLLSTVDNGTDNSFRILDSDGNTIQNIIPFNYAKLDTPYENTYNYKITTNKGVEIPFGVGDWLLDTYSGTLTFYGELPEGIDHTNPPKISFYQYIGQVGFKEDEKNFTGAIISLENFLWNETKTCSINSNELYKAVALRSEEVEKNFISTYGFDGADTNEGIALSFEKVLPILDTKTKDPVKGYDESQDQIVRILLTNKLSTIIDDNSGIQVCFTGYYNSIGTHTFDTSKITTEGYYTLRNSKNEFIIVYYDGVGTKPATIGINTIDSTLQDIPTLGATLLYWRNNEYIPFVLEEPRNIDFGFPIVTLDGKIPPSLLIDTNYLSQYQDSLTPDFYGPRVATYVIASKDTPNAKSSDFIVRNEEGYRIADFFKGNRSANAKVIYREGNYILSAEDNTISTFENNILEGSGKVIINGKALTAEIKGLVVFNNFDMSQVALILKGSGTFNISNCAIKSLDASEFKGNLELRNVKILESLIETKHNNNNLHFFEKISTPLFKINGKSNIQIESSVLGEVEFSKDFNPDNSSLPILFTHNRINKFGDAKSFVNIYLNSNTITSFPEKYSSYLPRSNKENTTGRFKIFNKSTDRYKFADFAKPFIYREDLDIIELLYQKSHIFIDENGQLDVTVGPEDIVLKEDTTYELNSTAKEGSSEDSRLKNPTFAAGSVVDDIFKSIFKNKADLNSQGKIPLQEIPDSIASGGLRYVGSWNFVDAKEGGINNIYPTLKNIADNPDEETSLQKGWFFIVSVPKGERFQENPTLPQEAFDGIKFTAGDWIIFEGTDDGQSEEAIQKNIESKYWSKLDRAYENPLYISLPSTDPNNQPWYWKDNKDGGALDFSSNKDAKTLYKALYEINLQLKKLEPQKPINISDLEIHLNEESLPSVKYFDYNDKIEKQTYYYDESIFEKSIVSISLLPKNKSLTKTIANTHFYFGDNATIKFRVNSQNFTNANISTESEAQTISLANATIEIPKAIEAFSDQNNALNYWKGLCPKINFIPTKENSLEISLENVKVNGEDALQSSEYNGSISFVKSYKDFLEIDQNNINISTNFSGDTFFSQRHTVSGNQVLTTPKVPYEKINKIIFKGLYHDGYIPVTKDGILGSLQLKVEGNNSADAIWISKKVNFTKDDIKIENNEVILEEVIFELLLNEFKLFEDHKLLLVCEFNKYLSEDSFKKEIVLASHLYFDNSQEPERYLSKLSVTSSGQMTKFDSDQLLTYYDIPQLQYKEINGKSLFTWPSDNVYQFLNGKWQKTSYEDIQGENINGSNYCSACFKVGTLHNASGFTIRINAPEVNNFGINTLNGKTNFIILQGNIIKDTIETGWFNCNESISGNTIQITGNTLENMNLMYAGKSSALEKRITFGRKKVFSGDLYIRIGLADAHNLEFYNIELIEEI